MARYDDYPRLDFNDRGRWRTWLESHHAGQPGVFLILYKQASGKARLSYADAVEEALCFGWIDSLEQSIDGERVQLLFTPRKPGGTWAKSNKERVERLIAAGSMTPAGQAVIDAARRDGSWSLLDSVEALIVPDDLTAALDARPGARQAFERLSPSARKQMLFALVSAKRPDTRQKRLEAILTALRQ